MAIFLNSEIKLLHPNDKGSYDFYESKAIDLKSTKVPKSDDVVLYAPNDLKKLKSFNICYFICSC